MFLLESIYFNLEEILDDRELSSAIKQITQDLYNSEFKPHIVTNISSPIAFRGEGEIKLIVLAQDPTVQDPEYRERVKVTLLLDQPGNLRTYLTNICNGLGISLEDNLYATNLLKNFFSKPPDQIWKEKSDFLRQISSYWMPLLVQEIAEFINTPILTLREPVLNCLTKSSDWVLIRNYWGYEGPSKYGKDFRYISREENNLNRTIFPFPHIHGLKHKFYQEQMSEYIKFIKSVMSY